MYFYLKDNWTWCKNKMSKQRKDSYILTRVKRNCTRVNCPFSQGEGWGDIGFPVLIDYTYI